MSKLGLGSLVSLLVLVVVLEHVEFIHSSPLELKVLMPKVSPKTKDIYLCHRYKLDEEKPVYITEFEANSTKEIAHHILLFACMDTIDEDVWNCGEMAASTEDAQYKSGPVCTGRQSIVFAWALDAPKLVLPQDVAFKLGGNTDKKYLVMQVHYADVDRFKNGETDSSGLVLKGQTEQVPNLAAVYFSATSGQIKSGAKDNFETACEMDEDVVMHPFAYRTHAHKLGIVNSGYLVRNDEVTGEQTWTEIGRRSPQLPQMFFPVTNKVEIGKGDIIASRCTMENTRDHTVRIGSTGNDEMCNFYIMYYVKGEKLLQENMCFRSGPPFWYFSNFKSSTGQGLDLNQIPADASEVPAEQLVELEQMKKSGHNMHGMHHDEDKSKSADEMSMHEMNMEMNEQENRHHEQDDDDDEMTIVNDKLERDLDALETELRLRRLLQKLNSKNNN